MLRLGVRVWGFAFLASLCLLAGGHRANAVSLDKDGTMKLGVRTYVNTRIGTEATDEGSIPLAGGSSTAKAYDTRTFPSSGAGHIRQNRFFMEAEFDHDLDPLRKSGFGPFRMLDYLPFRIRGLK